MADIFFGASEAEAVGVGVSRAHPKKCLNAKKTSQIRIYVAHAKRALAVRNIRDSASADIFGAREASVSVPQNTIKHKHLTNLKSEEVLVYLEIGCLLTHQDCTASDMY